MAGVEGRLLLLKAKTEDRKQYPVASGVLAYSLHYVCCHSLNCSLPCFSIARAALYRT
jgi:hypothetical protein